MTPQAQLSCHRTLLSVLRMWPPNISLEQTAQDIACGFDRKGDGLKWPSHREVLRTAERDDVGGAGESHSDRGLPRAAAQLSCYVACAHGNCLFPSSLGRTVVAHHLRFKDCLCAARHPRRCKLR